MFPTILCPGSTNQTIDANPAPVETHPEPARPALPEIPGHELLEVIGRGGMGVVYRARHRQLGRLVAVKTLTLSLLPADPLRDRFLTEARVAAQLQHPNLVRLYQVSETGGQPWLSLEYVEGGTLAQAIRSKPFSPLATALLMEKLSRALHCCHEQGIIHRDLKPANILLTLDGQPKVTDFGLAKWLNETTELTKPGEILGTVSYMAPEQASGAVRKLTPACDVYALGAILYEMLTGRPPFYAPDAVQTLQLALTTEPLRPRRLQPAVPRDLETICLKCLEKSPKRRYASAAELGDDLGRFARGEPIVARPVRWYERTWKWARRRPGVAGLVSLTTLTVLVMLIGGAWYNARLQKELKRSQRLYAGARDFTNRVLLEHVDKLNEMPGSTEYQKELIIEIGSYQEQLARDGGSDARLDEGIAARYERMGRIQGDAEDFSRVQQQQALASYDQALERYEELLAGGDEVRVRINYLTCRMGRAEVLDSLGRANEAMWEYGKVLDEFQELEQVAADSSLVRDRLATLHGQLADVCQRQGDHPRAIREMQESLALRLLLRQQFPEAESLQAKLAEARFQMGQLLESGADWDAAHEHYLLASEWYAAYSQSHPENARITTHQSATLIALGDVETRLNRLDAAGRHYRDALTVHQTQAGSGRSLPPTTARLTPGPKAPVESPELDRRGHSGVER